MTLIVSLHTGGQDKPYAIGLAAALASVGVGVDFIGSDEVNGPELHGVPEIRYLNLRGSQRRDASLPTKILRVLRYYARLVVYAVFAKPAIFHILWNNKLEIFDRIALTLYYRLLRRRVVLTAHNVNERKWNSEDFFFYRLSLRIQYFLAERIFVHTELMKQELMADFGVPAASILVIPFGMHNTLPAMEITAQQAREALGLDPHKKILLFFGYIKPYKGLEHLVEALGELRNRGEGYRLLIAGPLDRGDEYFQLIRKTIDRTRTYGNIVEHIGLFRTKKCDCILTPRM